MIIRAIPPHLVQQIADKHFKVLRRKKDNVALNVSYTEYGLKWTANKLGRALMYDKAFITRGRVVPARGGASSTPKISLDVYVEHFVPRNHDTEAAQVAEFTWLNKALAMSY